MQGLGGKHGGDPVGHADHGERHDPQDRAAVGQHQQERHHARGGEQQPEVGAVEDRGQVGPDRGRTGDLRGDTVGQVGAQVRAQTSDRVGHLGGAGPIDAHDAQGSRAVLAGHQVRCLGAGHRPVRPPQRGQGGRIQFVIGGEQHHRRGGVSHWQLRLQLDDRGAVRTLG